MKHEYNLQEPNFTVSKMVITSVSREKNYRHSVLNGRLNHGFIYIVSGKLRHDFFENAYESLTLQAGDLVFIPKSCAYSTTYLDDLTEIRVIQFDISAGELPSYLSAPQKILLPNANELIHAFFRSFRGMVSGHPFYHLSCLYHLLWQIDESYTRIPAKYQKLQPALLELGTAYDQNKSIAYYAALCDMSEVNFRRLFREFIGKSPIEYRNDLRLSNARIKLQSGEYNVSEAAEASGFSNLSFFIRLYKKKFGYTPKKE